MIAIIFVALKVKINFINLPTDIIFCFFQNNKTLFFLDIQRPKFANENECANGISLSNSTLLDRSYGVINFDAIGVTDNSGGPITIESTPPGYQLGRSYNIGITDIKKSLVIKFTATDASNNKAECKFFVEILG